jgi:D-proline reductase (dithiol) PrdB
MASDGSIRDRVGDIPTPEFASIPLTEAPLRAAGDVRLWQPTDGSFTVLPGGARDVQLSHFSPNFDRTGFAADINVVYPVDRLEEMAAAGEIGSVANQHISFMGAQFDATFSTILLDSGPAAAQVLLDDDVDVVLLTPI